jgi:hypothetical protein
MIMNAWNGSSLRNVFTEGENNYRGAMLEVALELNALFIDLNMKSYENVKELGFEYAAYFLHMGLEPGEYPNYPEGSGDVGTHYQEMGAMQMAGFVVEGISELQEDPDMKFLAEARTPLASFSTEMIPEDAGLLTRPGALPLGAQVTLKTRLKADRLFDHWEDSTGNTVTDQQMHMITLQDSSYFYRAVATDCNGEVGGGARIDHCFLCSGGTTGYPPCEMIFESEDACNFTGYASTVNIGELRRRVVNTKKYEDSPFIEYRLQSPKSGTYDFVFFYQSKTDGEQLNVTLNEVEAISGLELIQADELSHVRFQLDLVEGLNILIISSTAARGGILFDMLAAYSDGLSEASCNALSYKASGRQDQYRIYPNPFSSMINIHGEGPFEFRVFNATGIEVLAGTADGHCTIASGLPRGSYLLQIIHDGGISARIVHKH